MQPYCIDKTDKTNCMRYIKCDKIFHSTYPNNKKENTSLGVSAIRKHTQYFIFRSCKTCVNDTRDNTLVWGITKSKNLLPELKFRLIAGHSRLVEKQLKTQQDENIITKADDIRNFGTRIRNAVCALLYEIPRASLILSFDFRQKNCSLKVAKPFQPRPPGVQIL